MSFIQSLFGSSHVPAVRQQDTSFTKFFGVNNAPVSSFCNTIPILQPSLISTSFGTSLISLVILTIYTYLYTRSAQHTGVESRLLIALLLGNIAYSVLTFSDWFDLHYQIVLCNEYKNGTINLYQVSELIENYKLTNWLASEFEFLSGLIYTYAILVGKQFFHVIVDVYKALYLFIYEGISEASAIVSKLIHKTKA